MYVYSLFEEQSIMADYYWWYFFNIIKKLNKIDISLGKMFKNRSVGIKLKERRKSDNSVFNKLK